MAPVMIVGGDSINTSGADLHLTRFGWAGQIGRPPASAPRSPADVGFLSDTCLSHLPDGLGANRWLSRAFLHVLRG